PQRMVLIVVIGVPQPARIGRVERRALRLVVVIARRVLLVAPPPVRRVEPQPVLPNRTTEAPAHVVDLLDRARGCQPTGTELIVQVIALQAAACPVRGGVCFEHVSAGCWCGAEL